MKHKEDGSNTIPRFIRAWVLLQTIALLAASPFVLGLFAYGLAHADAPAAIIFLSCFAAAFGLIVAAPFALLRQGSNPLLKALKVLGSLVLVAGFCGLLALVWALAIDPVLETRKFEQAMQTLDVSAVAATPELIGGEVAGLRLAVEIRLPKEATFNLLGSRFDERLGTAIWEFMQSARVQTAEPDSRHMGLGPFAIESPPQVSLNGAPIASLPAFKDYFEKGYGSVTLAPGTYRIERILWFAGLGESAQPYPHLRGAKQPCIVGRLDQFRRDGLEFGNGRPLEARLETRLSLGARRGYRNFQVSRPLAFRFDNARWTAALPKLPLDQCRKP